MTATAHHLFEHGPSVEGAHSGVSKLLLPTLALCPFTTKHCHFKVLELSSPDLSGLHDTKQMPCLMWLPSSSLLKENMTALVHHHTSFNSSFLQDTVDVSCSVCSFKDFTGGGNFALDEMNRNCHVAEGGCTHITMKAAPLAVAVPVGASGDSISSLSGLLVSVPSCRFSPILSEPWQEQ